MDGKNVSGRILLVVDPFGGDPLVGFRVAGWDNPRPGISAIRILGRIRLAGGGSPGCGLAVGESRGFGAGSRFKVPQ